MQALSRIIFCNQDQYSSTSSADATTLDSQSIQARIHRYLKTNDSKHMFVKALSHSALRVIIMSGGLLALKIAALALYVVSLSSLLYITIASMAIISGLPSMIPKLDSKKHLSHLATLELLAPLLKKDYFPTIEVKQADGKVLLFEEFAEKLQSDDNFQELVFDSNRFKEWIETREAQISLCFITTNKIRKAYIGLQKRFHPDKQTETQGHGDMAPSQRLQHAHYELLSYLNLKIQNPIILKALLKAQDILSVSLLAQALVIVSSISKALPFTSIFAMFVVSVIIAYSCRQILPPCRD